MAKLLLLTAVISATIVLGFGSHNTGTQLFAAYLVIWATCVLIGYGATHSRVRGTAASVEHAQALDTLSSQAAKRDLAG